VSLLLDLRGDTSPQLIHCDKIVHCRWMESWREKLLTECSNLGGKHLKD